MSPNVATTVSGRCASATAWSTYVNGGHAHRAARPGQQFHILGQQRAQARAEGGHRVRAADLHELHRPPDSRAASGSFRCGWRCSMSWLWVHGSTVRRFRIRSRLALDREPQTSSSRVPGEQCEVLRVLFGPFRGWRSRRGRGRSRPTAGVRDEGDVRGPAHAADLDDRAVSRDLHDPHWNGEAHELICLLPLRSPMSAVSGVQWFSGSAVHGSRLSGCRRCGSMPPGGPAWS